MRDEADSISTELKSKNGDTHYWHKSAACLVADRPALAEVMELDCLLHGEIHPMNYAIGCGAAQSGRHNEARKIFQAAIDSTGSV